MLGYGGTSRTGFLRPRDLKARTLYPLAINLICAFLLFLNGSAKQKTDIDQTNQLCDPTIGIFDVYNASAACGGLLFPLPSDQMDVPPPAGDPTPLPVELPKLDHSSISFTLTPSECIPWELCDRSPIIQIKAFEKMQGETVESVHVRLGDVESMYPGDNAFVRVPETDEKGVIFEYWAVSSFEQTETGHTLFTTRYLPLPGDESGLRIFDLIASDWHGEIPPGSLIWSVFPPIDDTLPKALDQPFSPDYLLTTNRYIYLAGYLIASGNANAKNCPNNGLMENGAATVCGEKAAAQAVLDWQNQYNEAIYTSALEQNIPARVLKGIIAQETQFWPTIGNPREVGLGMFTENGADLVLMWNIPYYLKICQPIYGVSACSVGYASMTPPQQQVLRKAIIDQVGTEAEIDLLAATIYASANQIGQLIPNNMGYMPHEKSGYVDLWKITTGNYYAGAGCVSRAINQIANQELELTWDELVIQMDDNCKPAGKYVDRVFGASE